MISARLPLGFAGKMHMRPQRRLEPCPAKRRSTSTTTDEEYPKGHNVSKESTKWTVHTVLNK